MPIPCRLQTYIFNPSSSYSRGSGLSIILNHIVATITGMLTILNLRLPQAASYLYYMNVSNQTLEAPQALLYNTEHIRFSSKYSFLLSFYLWCKHCFPMTGPRVLSPLRPPIYRYVLLMYFFSISGIHPFYHSSSSGSYLPLGSSPY